MICPKSVLSCFRVNQTDLPAYLSSNHAINSGRRTKYGIVLRGGFAQAYTPFRLCEVARLSRNVSPDARRPNCKRAIHDQGGSSWRPSHCIPAKTYGNNQNARAKVHSLRLPPFFSRTDRGCNR